jgi:hypothetical protein
MQVPFGFAQGGLFNSADLVFAQDEKLFFIDQQN